MQLKAIFIGNHKEIIYFLDKWLESGHAIFGIVSDDEKVADWVNTKYKNINLNSYEILDVKQNKYLSLKHTPKPHVLFSIINHQPLPNEILELAEIPINYHAGQLPQYRGVYCTSWAIYNGKSEYNITWHVMSNKLDAGIPLLTHLNSVNLKNEEDAYQLEIACLELAKQTFVNLITSIESSFKTGNFKEFVNRNNISDKDLNEIEKSFNKGKGCKLHNCKLTANISHDKNSQNLYRFIDKIDENGLILAEDSMRIIQRKYLALRLDNAQPNYFGIVKYNFNGITLYPDKIVFEELNVRPEIKIDIDDNNIEIYKGFYKIKLMQLRDETGYLLNNKDLEVLNRLSNKIPEIEELKTRLKYGLLSDISSKHLDKIKLVQSKLREISIYDRATEEYWVSILKNSKPANLTFDIKNTFRSKLKTAENQERKRISWEITNQKIANCAMQDVILVSVMAYFNFLNQTVDKITFGYTDDELLDAIGNLKPYFSEVLPLTFNSDSFDNSLLHIMDSFGSLKQLLKTKKTYCKDIKLRYPALRDRDLSFPVIIYVGDKYNIFNKLYCNHWIIISVNNANLEISYDSSFINEDRVQDFEEIMNNLKSKVNEIVEYNLKACIEKKSLFIQNIPNQILPYQNVLKDIRTDTVKEFKTVISLYEQQVKDNKSADAFMVDDKKFTYNQIYQKMLSLSQFLFKSKEVLSKTINHLPIIIYLPANHYWVIAILSAMKVNRPFIAMNYKCNNIAEEELRVAMQDSDATEIITTTEHLELFKKFNLDINIIDITNKLNFAESATEYPVSLPDDIAYIIYTSGTTGQPKGVRITHSNLSFSIQSRIKYYKAEKNIFLFPITGRSFDATFGIILWALCSGGKFILLSDEDRLNTAKQLEVLTNYNAVYFIATPQQYNRLLQELDKHNQKEKIRQNIKAVILGGDKWPDALFKNHAAILYSSALYNEYGPSECTIWSTVALIYSPSINPSIDHNEIITLGNAIDPMVQLYILDNQDRMLPPGITGELVIVGPNVALGYKDNESSGFKIKQHNNCAISYYRTGDWVRRTKKDELIFVGRKDNELKIKGMRIDTQQIINCIKKLSDVKDAYVLKKNNLLLRICILSDASINSARNLLKKEVEYLFYLKRNLPSHLVPNELLICNNYPLNNNGKIDEDNIFNHLTKKYKSVDLSDNNEYLQCIITIWNEVLERKINDHVHTFVQFEQLGIDSMNYYRAAQLLAKREEIKYDDAKFILSLNNIFMQAEILKYLINQRKSHMSNHGCILLTGATGFLGTQFLHQMSEQQNRFVKIYCLCNDEDGSNHENIINKDKLRINQNLIELGFAQIDFEINKNKYIFIVGNIEEEGFKLNKKEHDQCIADVECIYHFAAKVKHKQSYSALESPNTKSINHILEFVQSCKKEKMRVHFASTIQTLILKQDVVLEREQEYGYVKSKMVAEEILEKYSNPANKTLTISIYKMGWAGWNENNKILKPESDQFHCLLETCLQMQAVPIVDVNVYMLPVHILIHNLIEEDLKQCTGNDRGKVRIIKPAITQQVKWLEIANILDETIRNSIEYKLKSSVANIKLSSVEWLKRLRTELATNKYPIKPFKELYTEGRIGLLDVEDNRKDIDLAQFLIGVNGGIKWNAGLLTPCKDDDEKDDERKVKDITEILAFREYGIIIKLLKNKSVNGILFSHLQKWLDKIPSSHPQRFSAIHLIIRNNKLDEKEKVVLIKKLTIKYKQAIDHKTGFGTTPLYEASIYRLTGVIRFLINHDPNIRHTLVQKSNDKFSVFMVSCWFGDYASAKLFFEEMIKHYPTEYIVTNILTSLNDTKEACIHRAITAEASDIIQLMFDKRYTNKHDWDKMLLKENEHYDRPILHHAAIIGNERIIIFLIDKVLQSALYHLLIQPNKHGHNFISFIHADKSNLKIKITKKCYGDLHENAVYDRTNYSIIYLNKYEEIYIENEKQLKDCELAHKHAFKMIQNKYFNSDLNQAISWIGSLESDVNGYITFQYIVMYGFDLLIDEFIAYCIKNNTIIMLKDVLNYKNKKQANRTALHLASRENYIVYDLNLNKINLISFPNIKIIVSLIETNYIEDKLIDINAMDDNNVTPLYEIIFSGIYINSSYSQDKLYDLRTDNDLLVYMLLNRANIFAKTLNNHTMISLACWRNAYLYAELLIQVIRDLMEKRKEVNQPQSLEWLIPGGDILLNYLNLSNSTHETPLHCAVDNRNPDLVQLLLDNGANPNGEVDYYGKAPLHRAVERIQEEKQLIMIKQLVRATADISKTKSHHRKAEDLIHTEAMGLKEAVQVLLDTNGYDEMKFSLANKKMNQFADTSKSIVTIMTSEKRPSVIDGSISVKLIKQGLFSKWMQVYKATEQKNEQPGSPLLPLRNSNSRSP